MITTEMGKSLQVFETSIAGLPTTANEVFVFVRDNLIEKTKNIAVEVEMLEQMSRAQSVTDEQTAAESRNLIVHKKDIVDQINAALGDWKKKADKLHAGVCAAEKVLMGPLKAIEDNEKAKIGGWIQAETARKKAEYLAEQQRIQRENEKRLKAAHKKIDELVNGTADLNQKIAAVNAILENPEATQEEVDLASARISTLRGLLANQQDKVAAQQAKAVEAAKPVLPAVQLETKMAGMGIKKEWVVTVSNPMQLLNAIVNGIVPITVIDWNAAALKKFANNGGVPAMSNGGDPIVPGCVMTEDIKISTRR